MDRTKAPATLKDVANAAGVSISCVSVVLNGTRSGTRVSDRTRQLVIEHASRLGYRPNAIGRSLQRRRTRAIGFYSVAFGLDAGNTFLAELIGGMQEVCRAHELALLLYNLHEEATVNESLQRLTDGYVDGLLVFGRAEHPVVAELIGSHLPMVALVDPIEGIASVRADDHSGGATLADELASMGYRRVLYRRQLAPSVSVQDRMDAFLEACSGHGIEVQLGGFVHADTGVEFTAEERVWLQRCEGRPSVVAVWEDHTAVPTVALLREMGFRVPEEIGVTGYNGVYTGPWPSPPLTTIKAPWRQVAHQAVELLLNQIEGEHVDMITTLPIEFVPGTTTRRALDEESDVWAREACVRDLNEHAPTLAR